MTAEAAYDEAQRYDHEPSKNPHLIDTFLDWKGPIRESLRTGEPIPFVQPG